MCQRVCLLLDLERGETDKTSPTGAWVLFSQMRQGGVEGERDSFTLFLSASPLLSHLLLS